MAVRYPQPVSGGPMPQLSPAANMQRNNIASTMMNIARPPPAPLAQQVRPQSGVPQIPQMPAPGAPPMGAPLPGGMPPAMPLSPAVPPQPMQMATGAPMQRPAPGY